MLELWRKNAELGQRSFRRPQQRAILEQRLLEHLKSSEVPIAILVAPGGFGKTELAKRYASHFARPLIVRACPGMDAQTLLAELRDDHDCIVVDAAERLDDATWQAVLLELASAGDPRRAVVVCTRREPDAFSFADVVPPHNLMVIRRGDFELALDEIVERAPEGNQLSWATLYAIYSLAQGWPVPTLALLRLASRDGFTRTWSMARPEFTELFDWLDVNALRLLPAQTRETLVRCVASSDLTPSDLERLYPGDRLRNAQHLYRTSQQAVLGIAGEIRVHPLLALLVRMRHGAELQRCAREAIADFLSRDEPIRAVRTCINAGQTEEAARMLDALTFDAAQQLSSYAYPGLSLEYFSGATPDYERYPLLWLQLVPCRYHVAASVRLTTEGARILRESGDGLSERVRCWIRATMVMLAFETGQTAVAQRLAAELEDAGGADSALMRDLARMYCAGHRGAYREVQQLWAQCAPRLRSAPSWLALHSRAVLLARARLNEVTEAQELLDSFSSLARLGAAPHFAAQGAMNAAIFAWAEGDEARYDYFRTEWERLARLYPAPMLWNAMGAMRGRDLSSGSPSLRLDVRSALLLGAYDRAVKIADEGGDVGNRLLSRIYAVRANSASAPALLEEARELARETDSHWLRDQVRALERARPQAITETLPSARPLEIDVASGGMVRNGAPVRVSEGTLQLLTLLAVVGRPLRREAVIDRLWPDLDGDNAANALKVCIHRARAQLGDPTIIVSSHRTVGLREDVGSNYETLLELAQPGETPLSESRRSQLASAFERLTEGLQSGWAPWPWFAPYRGRLGDAMRAISIALVDDELSRGNDQAALQIARTLIGVDPFDEEARAQLIRIYNRTQNAAAAVREYRQYCEFLARTSGVEPSQRLRALAGFG